MNIALNVKEDLILIDNKKSMANLFEIVPLASKLNISLY